MATLSELAELTGSQLHGEPGIQIDRVATLKEADAGSIAFLANPAYRKYLATTAASAVILDASMIDECPVAALVSANPYATYARIADYLHPETDSPSGISDRATITDSARIGEACSIAANVVIGDRSIIGDRVVIGPNTSIADGVRIGDDSRIGPNVVLLGNVIIGKRAIISAGVVIGSDGFGIAMDDGKWRKVPQLGAVVIGDDVEIGANTCVDRGALEDTVIEDGVKLDNLIQVAHNVRIGAHTAIAGCVGIAGSAIIGKYCCIGGNAGILGHLEITDHVTITAKSLVTRSIGKAGTYSSGVPLQENPIWRKNAARFGRLDHDIRSLQKTDHDKH